MFNKRVQHQYSKTKTRAFECTMCQRKFFLESYYILHVRSHLKDNHLLCHICGKRFSKIYYFQKHLRMHNLQKLQQDCSVRLLQDASKSPFQELKHDSCEKHVHVQCSSNAWKKGCLLSSSNRDEISPVTFNPESSLVPVQVLLKRFVSSPANIPIQNLAVCDVNKQASSQPRIHRTQTPLFLRFNRCQNSSVSNIRPPERISDGFSCNSCKMSFYYEAHLKKHICPPLSRDLTRGSLPISKEGEIPRSIQNLEPFTLPKDQSKRSDSTLNLTTVQNPSVSSERGTPKISSSEQSETSHPLGAKLLRHRHGRIRFSCNACKKLYYSKNQFDEHDCKVPVKETFTCHFCNRVYDRLGTFNKHLHTHTKPFVCKVCGTKFGRQNALTYHNRIHTDEKPYVCDVCKKTFAQKQHLVSHSRVHTGERPYACPVCEKTFARKSILDVHSRVHTGERPYSCVLCQKSFSNYSTLIRHKRSHTGEKPYSCEVCQKTFSEKKIMHQHLRKHETE